MRDSCSAGAVSRQASATSGAGADWAGTSRRSFLRGSVLAGATAGAAALAAAPRRAEADFIGGQVYAAQHFVEIQGNENAHVAFLLSVLGSSAFVRPPFLNLGPKTVVEFAEMSRTFEMVGAKTYLGAAPVINNPQTLAQAGSIAQIEARQAAVVNSLFGLPLSEDGAHFESPFTATQAAEMAMGFFADPGLPVSLANAIQPTRSDANDFAIFRFALSLEYLESTFYNMNVPRFFGPGR
jgi:hypothetical protein